MTHYLPAFTVTRNRTQRAVCGAYIPPREHASEPTCPDCKAYVETEASTEDDDFRAMGFVKDTDGTWIPEERLNERASKG